ncbi:MAG: DUF1294 domain-containing protein [Firmicutes bacterium]|nr:DUF1294 domain-containing protein [Bacillota bacterium]MCL1944934.1 DUF1294 domain-containing protein [Bacillota bacterium]MCL1954264.1 DUF1294 domain-containing protein [Bacillota bacterium]
MAIAFIIYFIIASIVAYAVMAHDKQAAKRHDWRIKESTLIIIAALGGSIGMLWAMHHLRHKTKHAKFTIGVPMILFIQAVLATLIIIYFA